MIKKTIKIPLFWKIYIIVVTIVLIGFVVLWSILWTALKKYEQSRPEYAMDKITEQIQLQDTGDFTKYVHTGENAYATIGNAYSLKNHQYSLKKKKTLGSLK